MHREEGESCKDDDQRLQVKAVAAGSMESVQCAMDPNLERTFRGHRNYVTAVSFSPSLNQLASGSGDNAVMLWNFKPQLRAFRYIGHKVCSYNVNDGNCLVGMHSCSPDADVIYPSLCSLSVSEDAV